MRGLLVGVEVGCRDEAEKVSWTGHVMDSTQPIDDVEPSSGETPLGHGITDRSQADANGISDPTATDGVANLLNGKGLRTIHATWIIPVLMDCQYSMRLSFQFL